MSDYFLLDPDYQDFPLSQKLKFLTVYGEQHTFILFAVLAIIFGWLMVSSSIKWIPVELSYLRDSREALGIVNASCGSSNDRFTYKFTVIDNNGQKHQYTGSETASKEHPCPNIGSSFYIQYLADQPEASARRSISPLSKIGSWGLIILFSLGFVKIGVDAITAFIRAIPKFVRLQRATTILEGQVISAKEAGFTFQMRVKNGHYVEVEYEFVADNRTFKHKQVKRREDLRTNPLPQPGTPIRVLYADENTYVML